MTADRSTAPAAVFDAKLAGWESREAAAEGWQQRVERAAGAMAASKGTLWNDVSERIGTCAYYRDLAAAALAADAEQVGGGEREACSYGCEPGYHATPAQPVPDRTRADETRSNAHPEVPGQCAHRVPYAEHCRDCEAGR